MEDINLDTYKSAWKSEQSFYEEKLSKERIEKFMQLTSKNISGLFNKSLLFDIVLKVLFSLSFGILFILYSNHNSILMINTLFFIISIICLLIQIRFYKTIPNVLTAEQSIKNILYSFIDYYKSKFILSLIITSLSSPLFFINGALYYFYFKYGTIRSFQSTDYIVFSTIIVVGFVLSVIIQNSLFSLHIGQLEKNLADIEEDTMSEAKLKHYRNLKNRNLIIYSTAVIIGLLLLTLFLFMI